MKNLNYWISDYDYGFGSWEIEFPYKSLSMDTITDTNILPFAKELLTIANKYELFIVESTPFPDEFRSSLNISYIDAVASKLMESKRLTLFGFGHYTGSDSLLITPSKISYFNERNQIEEAFINNITELLYNLKPNDAEYIHFPAESCPPISITARNLNFNDNMVYSEPYCIVIKLHSDIWFPRVKGFVERNKTPIGEQLPNFYDNFVLSSLHTYRLNQFLFEVKSITKNYGAAWRLAKSHSYAKMYVEQITSDGIII